MYLELYLFIVCRGHNAWIVLWLCVLPIIFIGRKEGNILFNDALNTFYLQLYGVRYMVKDHSDSERVETRCHHMGYSFRLTAKILLYAPSHRQDSTYHGLCYTSRGALAGTRNSSMGPPDEGSIRQPIAPWVHFHWSSVNNLFRLNVNVLQIMCFTCTTCFPDKTIIYNYLLLKEVYIKDNYLLRDLF